MQASLSNNKVLSVEHGALCASQRAWSMAIGLQDGDPDNTELLQNNAIPHDQPLARNIL